MVEQLENQSFGWSELVTSSDGKIFCFWVDELSGRSIIWFKYSSNNGISWSNANSISSFSKYLESIKVYKDHNELLHIFLIDSTDAGSYSLKHYMLQNDLWKLGDGQAIEDSFLPKTLYLSVAISKIGEISAIYSGEDAGNASSGLYRLYFTLFHVCS